MSTISIDETTQTLAALSAVLKDLRIPYYIGGSIASGAHGEFRATNDIDIICKLSDDSLQGLVAQLNETFYVDQESVQNSYRQKRPFNVIHKETFVKADFYTNVAAFEELEFKRATPLIPLPNNQKATVATPEYTIVAKLRWWKMGGGVSERQLQDVKGIIRINRDTLDARYLDKWAMEFGVYEVMHTLLQDRSPQ